MREHRSPNTAPVDAVTQALNVDSVTQALNDIVAIETEGNPDRQSAQLVARISVARQDLERDLHSIRRYYIVQLVAAGAAAAIAALTFVSGRLAIGEVLQIPGYPVLAMSATLIAILAGILATNRHDVKKKREFESQVLQTYLATRRELLSNNRTQGKHSGDLQTDS